MPTTTDTLTLAGRTLTGSAPTLTLSDRSRWRGPETLDLALCEDGTVSLSVGHADQLDGTPMDEWHYRTVTWRLLTGPCEADLTKIRAELAPGGRLRVLLARVHAGHSVEWDGRNRVGRLTEDAGEASADLADLSRGDSDLRWTTGRDVWDASTYLHGGEDYNAPPDLTDEDIARLAAEYVEEARDQGIAIDGGVDAMRDALEEARDRARDRRDADAEEEAPEDADTGDLVVCRSDTGDGGWSLHAPGSSDEAIATGDAPALVSGVGPITAADVRAAHAVRRAEAE